MSFDWSEFLDLAKQLAPLPVSHSVAEANLRSAISRAYYANHCKARNYLRDKGKVKLPITDIHRFVIDQFLNSVDRSRRDLGKDLNRLKVDRIKADYWDDFGPGIVSTTEISIRRAEQISIKLDNL
jgi:hypothetical protein